MKGNSESFPYLTILKKSILTSVSVVLITRTIEVDQSETTIGSIRGTLRCYDSSDSLSLPN